MYWEITGAKQTINKALAFREVIELRKKVKVAEMGSEYQNDMRKRLAQLKITRKHYLILSIENVLRTAERNGLLWLAAYNLSSLNIEKCRALIGRRVLLFPDLSKEGRAFSLWSERAKEFEAKLLGTRFFMSDLLEKHAHDEGRLKGYDLADYLERIDWRLFRSGG